MSSRPPTPDTMSFTIIHRPPRIAQTRPRVSTVFSSSIHHTSSAQDLVNFQWREHPVGRKRLLHLFRRGQLREPRSVPKTGPRKIRGVTPPPPAPKPPPHPAPPPRSGHKEIPYLAVANTPPPAAPGLGRSLRAGWRPPLACVPAPCERRSEPGRCLIWSGASWRLDHHYFGILDTCSVIGGESWGQSRFVCVLYAF
jgi:hypothetical protein